MRGNLMIALFLGLAAAPAFSEDAGSTAAPPAFGDQTRAWTSLQESGAAASKVERPLSGEAGTRAYERYLHSFEHPIPERFERESFGTGSSGGGSK
jgi:hypothetical protein